MPNNMIKREIPRVSQPSDLDPQLRYVRCITAEIVDQFRRALHKEQRDEVTNYAARFARMIWNVVCPLARESSHPEFYQEYHACAETLAKLARHELPDEFEPAPDWETLKAQIEELDLKLTFITDWIRSHEDRHETEAA